jgi:hypothetical protein
MGGGRETIFALLKIKWGGVSVMLTNKEIEVLCYCRGCLNRKCGLDLERSDIKHLKMQKISLEKSLTMIW